MDLGRLLAEVVLQGVDVDHLAVGRGDLVGAHFLAQGKLCLGVLLEGLVHIFHVVTPP